MLKPLGERLKRQRVFTVSKYHLLDCFLITKGKRSLMKEKPGKHHLWQMIKVNINIDKLVTLIACTLDMM